MTQQGLIKYLTRQHEKYIVFLPSCGQVGGVLLTKTDDTARLCDALIDLATK